MGFYKQFLVLSIIGAFTLFSSCKQDNGTIIIKGNIKGLTVNQVYLQEIKASGIVILDSTAVTGGKFEFDFKPDTSFQPKLISIVTKNKRMPAICVYNPRSTGKEALNSYCGFIMEPGTTELKGDLTKEPGVYIKAGTQNEVYFKNIKLPYVQLSKDTMMNNARVIHLKNLVKETPDAFWLLYSFSNFKSRLTHRQLVEVYNEFSDNIKNSPEGRKAKIFLDNQPANKNQFINGDYADVNGDVLPLIDKTKKLNLITFWASWCMPCRREIPALINIRSKFNKSELRIVSVSIDQSVTDWLKAVEEEQMNWLQLQIKPAELEVATARYNLLSIPQLYLVNNKGKVVIHLEGIDEGTEEKLQALIAGYFAKN